MIGQVVHGLGSGAVYAALALALVLVHRFTGVVNFAQGELAMVSAYVAWQLVEAGLSYWVALPLTMVVAFAAGALAQRLVMRRAGDAALIMTIGLYVLVHALAAQIWTSALRAFPDPFPGGPLGVAGPLAVVGAVLALLYLVIRHSGAGLTLRAVAADPRAARLAGIRVGRVHALGWGLAAVAGAASGVLVAPVVFLEPGMMGDALVSALAAAAVGGFANPVAAVAGGLLIGVAETLAGTYLWADLRVVVPLAVLLALPAVRAAGLTRVRA
ncbi:branched-chain amino acid ABC transporter permease [Herbidospora daliensis]|uniref:branched-chain amino acid ABC transporter permease n=1 Tax=Herbidospora daliensis TaxID=295585 RepID=UPI0007823E20|nr:branched-chain amino acid ABC transporter permease [Herbidospora daliensis]